jgi:hypothetical protein
MVIGMKDILLSNTDMEMNQAFHDILSEKKGGYQYLDIVKERILGFVKFTAQ